MDLIGTYAVIKKIYKLKQLIQQAVVTKLFAWIFSLYLLVAIITTAVYLFAEFSHAKTSIISEMNAVNNTLGGGIARAIWILNEEQVQAQIKDIPHIPFIVGVSVESDAIDKISYGVTMDTAATGSGSGAGSFFWGPALFSCSQPLVHKLPNNVAPLGKITLYSNIDVVWQRFEYSFILIIINVFVLVLAFSIIFFRVSNRLLSRPLEQLTTACAQLDLDNLDKVTVEFTESREDELSFLGQAFNRMVKKLHRSNQELHKVHRQYTLDLERQVQARTAELQKAHAELDTIFQNSQVGLMLLQNGRMITRANQRLAQIFGYSHPDEMKKLGLHAIHLSERTYNEFGRRFYDTLKQGEPFQVEYQMRKKDHSMIWCTLSGKALDTASPPDLNKGVLWVIEDISVRKAMEDVVIQAMERAEKARDEAEQANRFKSDFLANMSHEIRTPMNAITGMTYLLQQQPLTAEQDNYVKKIESSSNALLGLVNDILDFSKIEAGKLEIENVAFELPTVIENVATLVEMKAVEKGLDFIVSYDPGLNMNRHGDPLRLGQILTNLATNAVKFTETGEVGIYIDKKAGTLVRFEVRDTGIGLSKQQLGKLFHSFSQADASTTRKYGGTGLGLAISKQLVTMMRGRIWVESEQDKGSSFIFELPLKERPKPDTPTKTFSSKQVLIVDDTPSWQKVLVRLLKHYGIDPVVVSSGRDAIELVCKDKNAFDMILMDWCMPGMDGIETVKEIKNSCRDLPATIIMISAFKKDDIARQAKAAGIDVFLEKPVNPSLLYNVILGAFGQGIKVEYRQLADASSQRDKLTSLRGSRILLVEDNSMNREIIHGMLSHSGIEIYDAEDGAKAVAMFRKNPDHYELILMDIQMPEMDGYEATRRIRKMDTQIPIIALTANAMIQDIRKSSHAGMTAHLNKPIDVEKLFGTLLKYISRKADPIISGNDDPKTDNTNSQFSKFVCIDTAAGLGRVMGDAKLYAKLLKDFAAEYENADQTLLSWMKTDIDSAKRLTHTIKGLSASIGAASLHKAAKTLDENLSEQFIPEFTSELAKVVKEIKANKALNPSEPKKAKKPLDPQIRQDLMENLAKALKRKRPAVIHPVLDEIQTYALSPGDEALIKNVKSWISKYKFKDALNALEGALNALEGALEGTN